MEGNYASLCYLQSSAAVVPSGSIALSKPYLLTDAIICSEPI